MADDGMKFGEAYVEIRARLETLQQDLDASEQLVMQSTDRITQAQARAFQSAAPAADALRQTGEAAKGATESVEGLVDAGLKLSGFARVALFLVGAYTRIGTAAAGATAAAAGLGTALAGAGAAALAVVGLYAVSEGVDQIRRGVRRAQDAWGHAMDAMSADTGRAERGVEALSDDLRAIPLIGNQLGNVFDAFTGDAKEAERAVIGLSNGLKDVPVLGRLVSLGETIRGNLTGEQADIREALAGTQKINEQLDRRKQLIEATLGPLQAVRDLLKQKTDENALAGLEGSDQAREQNRIEMEALEAELDRQRQAFDKSRSAFVTRLSEGERASDLLGNEALRSELGEDAVMRLQQVALDPESVEEQMAEVQRIFGQAAEGMAQARQAAIDAQADTNARRLQQAQEREAAAAQREAAAQANALGGLTSGAAAARAAAGGDEFEAQRIELEAARQRALRDITVEGHDELLAVTEDYYDAKAALIDAREREQAQRDQELAEKRAEAEREARERELEQQEQKELGQLETNERLRSQILQERLRQAGDEVAARLEAIRQRFQEQIDQMERDGNTAGAGLAAKLRDLALQGAEQQANQAAGRRAEFEQVSLSRIGQNIGPGSGDDKVQRDQLARLDTIAQNTRPRNHGVAVAG